MRLLKMEIENLENFIKNESGKIRFNEDYFMEKVPAKDYPVVKEVYLLGIGYLKHKKDFRKGLLIAEEPDGYGFINIEVMPLDNLLERYPNNK